MIKPESARSSRTGASLLRLTAVLLAAGIASPANSLRAQTPNPIVASSPNGALRLIPQPRELSGDKLVSLDHGVVVKVASSEASDLFAAEDLRNTLADHAVLTDSPNPLRLQIDLLRLNDPRAAQLLSVSKVHFEEAMKAEGYILLPSSRGLAIIAASGEGIFYGVQTLKQMIAGSGSAARLHSATVRDWPALRYRGMDDDLSRGPVPTLDYQKKQIRTIAAYKFNIYSPYFESTLAYIANPLAAPPGGAMTRADVEALVRYAAQYHVTIIPEQEAFGHLHNVLTSELYAPLAETPHGHVLAPGQSASVPLIKQWFTEIVAMFPGPFLHIGADETFELGRGQTMAQVKQQGLGATYVDFLTQVNNALRPLNKKVLFWGDLAWNDPGLVKTLPKDMIAVPWVYDPQPQGFDRYIVPFKDAGMESWVAPGVNNWNRVYPDANLALPNIQGFIRDGQRLGSTGALTTVWNDDGEGLFAENWYGILFGAAASWQQGESSIEQYQHSYGSVFHGDISGKVDDAQLELAAAHRLLNNAGFDSASDTLFWVDPWSVDGKIAAKKLRPVVHEFRLHAERALVLLAEAEAGQKLREPDALRAMELGARRMDQIGMKFQLSDEIVTAYARAVADQKDPKMADDLSRELSDMSDTNGRCQDIMNAYATSRDLYEQAWLRENRTYWLRNVLARYDHAIDLWLTRADRVSAAQNQWNRDHTLPRAEDLGIPASLEN